MHLLNLFIDESGVANPKVTTSPCYILVGCLLTDQARADLKVKADQIKFKYWGKTDVVWHSREMSRGEGDFTLLKDSKLRKQFEADLFQFLNTGKYQLLTVLVDKHQARLHNWNELKVYDEVAKTLIQNYILTLLAKPNCRGRLVIESATSQKDFSYHKQLTLFLSQGLPAVEATFRDIQNVLTEIAFVTKRNQDIEEQIADLLTYAVRLRFTSTGKNLGGYDQQIMRVLNRKLFKMNPLTGPAKKKYHQHIQSYQIL